MTGVRQLRFLFLALLLSGIYAPARARGESPAPARRPERIDLEVPGYLSAIALVPSGEAPRPVLVATHGSFDRPEWACENWEALLGDTMFVLCPRGVLRWDSPKEADYRRFYYRSNQVLEQEIAAGLAALRKRFGARVAAGPMYYSGFSQGAIMGVPIILRSRAYTRIVLVEGGHGPWGAATAAAFRKLGGERAVLACGRASCLSNAQSAHKHLEAAGVQSRVVYGANAGHDYRGAVEEQMRAAIPFLLAGDDRLAPR